MPRRQPSGSRSSSRAASLTSSCADQLVGQVDSALRAQATRNRTRPDRVARRDAAGDSAERRRACPVRAMRRRQWHRLPAAGRSRASGQRPGRGRDRRRTVVRRTWPTCMSQAATCARSSSRSRVSPTVVMPVAVQLARPAELRRQRALAAAADAGARDRRRDGARAGARAARRAPGAVAAGGGRGDGTARRRDRGPREPDPRPRRRRGRPARDPLQHDARPARGLARSGGRIRQGPAPARRRRVARAAHAGHEHAHQHRAVARRHRHAQGGAAADPRRRARADRGADGADRRSDRARARRPAPRSGRGGQARRGGRGLARAGAAQLPEHPTSRPHSSRSW